MAENRTDIATLIDCTREIKLDNDVQAELSKLQDGDYYENIFSWKINHVLTINDKIYEFKTISDKIHELLTQQLKRVTYKDEIEQFDLDLFYLKLIACYELFINDKRSESLAVIEDFVNKMDFLLFDESNEHYFAAYNHIIRSTYAVIALSMNLKNYKEIMGNVKPKCEFNVFEKSVIHSVKALVFMKYKSMSKRIAFDEADKACALYSADAEWLYIWLIAKGRLNRQYNHYPAIENKQKDIADILFRLTKSFRHTMAAADVFLSISKQTGGLRKMHTYTDLTYKAMLKAFEQAGNNEEQIIECLVRAIDNTVPLLPKSLIEEKIHEYHNTLDPLLNRCFGNYYLKHRKYYKEAKMFFIRAKTTDLHCALNLIKIECFSKRPDEIPLIEMLMDAYEVFTKRKYDRIIILSHILVYCTYYKKDNDKLLYYMKMYIEEPFENASKYRFLNCLTPIFWIEKNFINFNGLIEHLFSKIELIYNSVLFRDKDDIMRDTFKHFSNMIMEGKAIQSSTKPNEVNVNIPWPKNKPQKSFFLSK